MIAEAIAPALFLCPAASWHSAHRTRAAALPTNSAAAYLSLPTLRSASRIASSGQPCIDRAASQAHATHTPDGKACRQQCKHSCEQSPRLPLVLYVAQVTSQAHAAHTPDDKACRPALKVLLSPVGCSLPAAHIALCYLIIKPPTPKYSPPSSRACLLPLKLRPAANKSSRLDCVKERRISIEGQSLSRQCGNLSFGLLRLFFRVLRLFSQPTSSASVSLLSGLPICIAAPFPRRSSKAAFSQGSSLIFLDKGWKDQLWVDFAGFIHCVSSLLRRCLPFQGCVLWARNG